MNAANRLAGAAQHTNAVDTAAAINARIGNRLAGLFKKAVLPAFFWMGLAAGVSAVSAQDWVEEGPAPIANGQVEGGTVGGEVTGAIHAVAPHPTNPDVLYVGAANGGIWRTDNATAASPSWTHLTAGQPSLSIGALNFDPTVASNQTLVAGMGRFSSFGSAGGARSGLLRTTDGGANWTLIDGGIAGLNVSAVAPRGTTIVVSADSNDDNSCNIGIFRSTDSGASFAAINNTIPSGAVSALVGDPANNAVLYAGVDTFGGACGTGDGVYKSTDTGATWAKVSDATMDAVGVGHFEIAVGSANTVFVSITPAGELGGVFRSADGGGTWTQMDLPQTDEDGTLVGIHPGMQGNLHNSIAVDPTDNNIVYVGGDRQTDNLPNSIGASNFTGRLFRGDASADAGMQWVPLTHSGTLSNSAPHADSRAMAFDAGGTLIEVDDGGIYRRTAPRSATGDWFSVNGNLKVTEIHDSSIDTLSNIIFSGNQDTGSTQQTAAGVMRWGTANQGDGGDTAVDTQSVPGQSIRYTAADNLAIFQRAFYDAGGTLQAQDFPALMVVSGADFTGQFVTPVEPNSVNPVRLIIGGGNSLYESADSGDTLSERAPGLVATAGSVAFGARDNEEILYVGGFGDAGDGVHVATTAGAAPTLVYTSVNQIMGLAMDPADSSHAFAIEPDRVLRTTDTGATFPQVTGNLGTFDFGTLRAITYLESNAGDALAVGGTRGVYLARASSGFSSWSPVGTTLPNVPVYELDYNPGTDTLIAGTLGRGAYSIAGVTTGAAGNLAPTPQNDSITVAQGGTATMLDTGQASLLANDTDPDMNTLTINTTPVTAPANGDVVINANGTFSYAHNGSLTNSDSFVYRVCDDGTPSLCGEATVTVVVTSIGGGNNCSSPNAAIPDDATNSLTDTLTVTDTGTLTDLDVQLNITHSFVGDISVSLRHDQTGTSVNLLTTPVNGSCGEANINVVLDDGAATPADIQCAMTGSAVGGMRRPTGTLADFNGEDFAGTWTLTVTDAVAIDSGTLVNWCLLQTTGGNGNDTVFDDGFEGPG